MVSVNTNTPWVFFPKISVSRISPDLSWGKPPPTCPTSSPLQLTHLTTSLGLSFLICKMRRLGWVWDKKLVAHRPCFDPQICFFSPQIMCLFKVTCQNSILKTFLIKPWPGSWDSPDISEGCDYILAWWQVSQYGRTAAVLLVTTVLLLPGPLLSLDLHGLCKHLVLPSLPPFQLYYSDSQGQCLLEKESFNYASSALGSYSRGSTSTTMVYLLHWAFPYETQEQ